MAERKYIPLRFAPPPPNALRESGGVLDEISSKLDTTITTEEILINILIELQVMNHYLQGGFNLHDESNSLRNDFAREFEKLL